MYSCSLSFPKCLYFLTCQLSNTLDVMIPILWSLSHSCLSLRLFSHGLILTVLFPTSPPFSSISFVHVFTFSHLAPHAPSSLFFSTFYSACSWLYTAFLPLPFSLMASFKTNLVLPLLYTHTSVH